MNKRNIQIDCLRGITCLMIVVFHLFCRYLQIFHGSNISWMSFWGSFGVAVFIMISGYFLGIECLKGHEEKVKFEIKNFLCKKIFRLWPSYALSITLTLLAVKLTGGLPGRECGWIDYLLNLFFVNGFIGTPYVDGAHWYLTTLLALICVFAIIRKLRIDTCFPTYVAWLVITMFLYSLQIYSIAGWGGGRYLGLAITGVSLAWMVNNTENQIKWIFVLVLSMIYSVCVQGVHWIVYDMICIVALVLCIKEKLFFLNNRVFAFLGKISYQWYLIHQNVGYLIIHKLEEDHRNEYSILYSFIALFITLIIAIGLLGIEKRLLAYRNQHTNNLGKV